MDIGWLIDEHGAAAQRAVGAGFDGVELYGVDGYLLQQFLAPNTNQRHDAYGGGTAGSVSIVHPVIDGAVVQGLRRAFDATLVASTGFATMTSRPDAHRLLARGAADVVAVGRPAIANPDLAHRWRSGLPETVPDPATFYAADDTGYTDDPTAATRQA